MDDVVALIEDAKLVRLAEFVARARHAGQVDQVGAPYADAHLAPIAAAVTAAGGSAAQIAAAWLHDAVEEGHTTLELLRAAGFQDEVLVLVDALSIRKGESRADYFRRIFACPDAVLVKRKDHDRNADPARLNRITNGITRERLRAKYDREAAWFAAGAVTD